MAKKGQTRERREEAGRFKESADAWPEPRLGGGGFPLHCIGTPTLCESGSRPGTERDLHVTDRGDPSGATGFACFSATATHGNGSHPPLEIRF